MIMRCAVAVQLHHGLHHKSTCTCSPSPAWQDTVNYLYADQEVHPELVVPLLPLTSGSVG